MKFEDYIYVRPNYEIYKNKFEVLVEEFKTSNEFEECNKKFIEINNLRKKVETMKTIANIRGASNTKDSFYCEEVEYWDENSPLYKLLDTNYFKVLLNSKFREELEAKYGKQLFKILDLKLKEFSPEIIEEIKNENKLISEYSNLLAGAKVRFKGKELNLAELGIYKGDKDRQVRKEAYEVSFKFFEDNEAKFDKIYDELVKVRDSMAKKLGYKNYVELGYIRRNRTDFNAEMVKVFRNEVKEHVVPLIEKLVEKQKQRLNLENIFYYDQDIEFLSGSAEPKGDNDWIIKNLTEIYSELSTEVSSLFEYMMNNGLIDWKVKDNKALGAYSEYLHDYKMPFIFANFNGTESDINTMIHETGHAIQGYSSKDVPMIDIIWPTFEGAEIHSMGMELLVWPWLEKLFLEDADKYRFSNLVTALKIIPYIVTVDSFQHYVYENPSATQEERKKAWREFEKFYQPYEDYENNEFLEKGGIWFKIRHIFQEPFYFIDYALAQICAFQIWKKSNEDREKCLEDYFNICKVGGTKSFLEIVDLCNLKSPFEEGALVSTINEIENWLESINYMNI